MTVLKNIEPRGLCWDLRGKLGGVLYLLYLMEITLGALTPKTRPCPGRFFGSKNCPMCFPLLTPKVRGEGEEGSGKSHLWFFFKFTAWNF